MASGAQPLTYGQQFDVQTILDKPKATKRSKIRKEKTIMAPETNEVNDQEQNASTEGTQEGVKRIQKTVFDLGTFSNVTLYKDVTLPKKPGSIQEAIASVGNNQEALMDLIFEGLKAKVLAESSDDMTGFCKGTGDYPLDMKNPLGEVYSGASASKEKKDLINSAVLGIAKMLGYSSENTSEKNAELKAQAMTIVRGNPVMMKSLQG